MMEKALFSLLDAVLEGKVFAMRAPQNLAPPFIVFQSTNTAEWRSLNGPSGIAQTTIQIDCYDEKYYDAKELAEQVRNALDGFSGDVVYASETTSFGGISFDSGFDVLDETDDPTLFRSSASYLVTHDQ